MFTSKFAANRAVMRVLLYGWQEHELPRFNFKFKPRSAGSLSNVLAKFSSEVHFLIVAEDAVDEATRAALSKGFHSTEDACYFVAGASVKDDFDLNGHTVDDNTKTILIYGFEDPLEPEIVPIFRPTMAGGFKDVLRSPQFRYSAAIIVESRPVPEDGGLLSHDARIEETVTGRRLIVLDKETCDYLNNKALYIQGSGGISYYILPPATVRELSN